MLAVIGFTLTGLIVLAFAATFDRYIIQPHKLGIWQFSAAYYCLACALLLWGMASSVNDPRFLQFSVMAGNGLLLMATGLLASLVIPRKYLQDLAVIGSLIGALLLSARAIYFLPEPAMRDGILLFNTQVPVQIAISAAFALIWLPVNVRIAEMVTSVAKQPSMQQLYVSLYVAATITALLFLSARRFIVIVLSFAMIGLLFLLLTASNYVVHRTRRAQGKHGA